MRKIKQVVRLIGLEAVAHYIATEEHYCKGNGTVYDLTVHLDLSLVDWYFDRLSFSAYPKVWRGNIGYEHRCHGDFVAL